MKSVVSFALGFLLVCSSALAQEPGNRKVLLIGIDGVRVDILAKAKTPNIDRLIETGVFSDRAQTRMPTVSGPGWSSMLTGVWSDKHGVKDNNFRGKAYGAYPDFLTRLERLNRDFNTFAVFDWPPIGSTISNGPMISDSIDVKMYFNADRIGYDVADARSVAAATQYLATEDVDAAFVYLGDVDEVGHKKGTLSPEYLASVELADRYVGQLLEALTRRPSYANEDWLILLATDHGRRDDGGHGQPSLQETTIFFLANGKNVAAGRDIGQPDIVDVAATALAHLRIPINPAWKLDGKPVGLKD